MGKLDNMMVYALERKIDKLEQQRAELLEALKSVQRWLDEEWEEYPFEMAVRFTINRAEAAE